MGSRLRPTSLSSPFYPSRASNGQEVSRNQWLKECLSIALSWCQLTSPVPLIFDHCLCPIASPATSITRVMQDVYVWFCSLFSSLKLMLLSLRISSHFPESPQMSICFLLMRKLWQCPSPMQSSATCPGGHMRGWVNRLHLPKSTMTQLFASYQPLPGSQDLPFKLIKVAFYT